MAKNKTQETPVQEIPTKETLVQRVRRITAKNIVDLKVTAGLFYGQLTGSEIVTNAVYGDSVRFKGTFALRVETDDIVHTLNARQMFLPSWAEEELEEAASQLSEGESLTFAIEVSQKPNEKSKTGYEWVYSHQLPLASADPLGEVQKLLAL